MNKSPRNLINSLRLRPLLALAMATCLTSNLLAIQGDFNVMIGESPRYLEAILKHQRGEITASELYVIKYEESCKNPSIRLHDRNRPALLLQNTSNQTNSIASFVIDIEQAGFEFGSGDNVMSDAFNGSLFLFSDRSDDGVTISSANYVSGDTTKLQINFTGLEMGKAVIFRVDLDPAPMVDVAFPDYRGILLGADVGAGATNPALISATFSKAGQPDATSTPIPFNGNITGTVQSGLLEVYTAQSRTEMFDEDGEVIPEPASLALLTLAGLGLLGRRYR